MSFTAQWSDMLKLQRRPINGPVLSMTWIKGSPVLINCDDRKLLAPGTVMRVCFCVHAICCADGEQQSTVFHNKWCPSNPTHQKCKKAGSDMEAD